MFKSLKYPYHGKDLENILRFDITIKQKRSTPCAADGWALRSARFQAVRVAWIWFRQNGVVSSRPPAGTPKGHNASCWGDWSVRKNVFSNLAYGEG